MRHSTEHKKLIKAVNILNAKVWTLSFNHLRECRANGLRVELTSEPKILVFTRGKFKAASLALFTFESEHGLLPPQPKTRTEAEIVRDVKAFFKDVNAHHRKTYNEEPPVWAIELEKRGPVKRI